MIYKNKADAKRQTGIGYLGSVNLTTKHQKAFNFNELTYSLYLAPAKMSGYEVCPKRTAECTRLCLNESGMNTMNMNDDKINKSRIAKTKLFFEEREFFMAWMIDEITTAHIKAMRLNYSFSVRLNNTSDISPEMFYVKQGKKSINILQLFPAVQFYDYTKVAIRSKLLTKYDNYDLTFSFSGHNYNECIHMLENNIRVAVVFNKVPTEFWGRKVIDGDKYDMRYRDDKNIIVGLKFKRVRNKLTKNKFVI
jgi:hypothetical protein